MLAQDRKPQTKTEKNKKGKNINVIAFKLHILYKKEKGREEGKEEEETVDQTQNSKDLKLTDLQPTQHRLISITYNKSYIH